MSDQTKVVFYKPSFEKTSQSRRDKILNEAVQEFAAKGFASTNINVIAEKAQISIGAMYSYFGSKEDLFLTIVSQRFGVLEEIIAGINVDDDFFAVIRQLFQITMDNTLKYPYLSQIYLDVTSHSMSDMAKKLSTEFESSVVDMLLNIIDKAKVKGTIGEHIDSRVLAFCIDNLLVMFQFSFSSYYYKERMRLYLGNKVSEEPKAVIDNIVSFIKNQL